MNADIDLAGLTECLGDILEIPRGGMQKETLLESIKGWDSVNALRVLSGIESEWGVRLKLTEFSLVRTAGELLALVRKEAVHARPS